VPTILDFLKIDYSEIFDGLSAIRSNPNRTIEAEDRYYCYLPNSNRRIKKDSNRIFGLRSIIDNKTKLSRTVLDSKNIYRKFSKEDLLEETSLEINDDEKKKLQFVNLNIPDKSVVTIDLKSELDKFNLNTEHMIKLQKTLSEENSLINNSIIELHKINDTMLMRLFLQLDKFIKNIFKKLKH
jgi:hypothetical protein